MSDRCGYAVVDDDGEQQPCDRPATGWRWYQDVGEHEDMLDVACDWHANEGGRLIAAAEAVLRDVERLRGELMDMTDERNVLSARLGQWESLGEGRGAPAGFVDGTALIDGLVEETS